MHPLKLFYFLFSDSRARLNQKPRSYPLIDWSALVLLTAIIFIMIMAIIAAANYQPEQLFQGV